MGIEAPLALLGLCAAILPWLVHRIRRRDLRVLPLPTLQLLRNAEAQKRRRSGFSDVLLLLLRVAIVAAATLALSVPYVVARLPFGDGTLASATIVVDDSLSMMRREAGETLFAAALEQARKALDSLPAHSEVSVIAAGRPARVLARRSTDPALARDALARLSPLCVRGSDWPTALELAAQQLDGARHPTRRLLLLSDFAAHTKLTAADLRFPGVQVAVERIGATPAPANVYFKSVHAQSDPSVRDQTSIEVELGVYGEAPERIPLRVRSLGREVARTELQFVAGAARTLIQVPTPPLDSDPTALLTIDVDDAIDLDNNAGVLLRPADGVDIMLVDGDPDPASDRDELHYARRALRLAADNGANLNVRSVDASALAKYDLTQVDVLVLANVEALPEAEAARVSRFVRDGGGLVVSAGDNVDPKHYNASLGEILPCRIRARTQGLVGISAPSPSPLFPAGPSGVAQTETRERLMLDCSGEPVLRFADGAPALALRQIGRGRSALLATSLDSDWTDLPLRPGYLPMLTRLIRTMAAAELAIVGPITAGDSVALAVPPDADTLEVVAPDGARQTFDTHNVRPSVEFTQTAEPGPYRVLAASGRGVMADAPRSAFIAQTPVAESDLSALPQVQSWGSASASGTAGATVRHSLAGYVLLLFALLVLGEGVLRNRRQV